MKVYRYMTAKEYNNIISGNLENVGHCFYNATELANTFAKRHKYKENTRYLHFFKDEASMVYMKQYYYQSNIEFYFTEFDIPLSVLLKGIGKGQYEPVHGYGLPESTREFIVSMDDFKKEWLVSASFDYDKNETIQRRKAETIKI